jgi:citrate synthase
MANVDQRGFSNQAGGIDHPPGDFLEASEAAAFLGIKRQTLYAYASRSWVKSVPSEDGRSRRYLRTDLERLKARHDARSGHGPVAAAALRWGEPVLESAITAITERGPRYRGHLAVDLAERGCSFEDVAELLWTGQLPEGVLWPAPSSGLSRKLLQLVPPKTAVPGILSLCTAALAVRDLDRFGASAEAEWVRARRLVKHLAAALSLGTDPARFERALESETIARAVACAWGVRPSSAALALINSTLVLCADHELNPSTFTVRVAASSGADLYACVEAALATHSGPRHGGACDRIEALLDELERPGSVQTAVRERLKRGEAVPGFQQPLYPKGDPRAVPLIEQAARLAAKNVRMRTLLELVTTMREVHREFPSADMGVVASARALGAPVGAAVGLFALGRSAGWIAHALEQRAAGFLMRPRARYVGP